MNRHSLALFGVVVAWTLTGVGKAGEPGRSGEPRLRSAATATESASPAAHKGSPAGLPPLRLIAKPADHIVPRRAHVQPAAPAGAKEIPYVETAPEPALTDAERQRGYLLFSRPTVEPVYPNTHPRPDERLEALVAFATPGQFEPLTLALYPLRPLANLKVRVSALVSSKGEIPADCIDVRLGTFWNIGYPSYTTVDTYQRTPELLERVTVYSSPAGECQRYWLSIHVPDDAGPGLYRGTVTLWDDGFDQAVSIPMALRVLGFRLVKDPAKHYSAYFYTRNRTLYRGRSEAFIRKAAENDYRAMADFGLDMLPTLCLSCEDGKRIVVRDAGEIPRMLRAGLRGPAPVIADNVIQRVYRDTTPTGNVGSHWQINPLPPLAFYDRITELFRALEAERKAKGWPELICCPIDEVDLSCKEFGVKVYAAVKAAGLKTYATKDPTDPDAAAYAPYLDIWCSQPYSEPFERIIRQKRYEYWCYPNHNAGEIKDRLTMCKGGRMTYGFGSWKSGYTTLIPWHWCWTCEPDPWDYLRGHYSGCGQRVDDDGEVIPAVYWSCFREGFDDARYVYTLQRAVVQRQDSADPACQAAVREGRRLLQETWDSIRVQPKYLATGMWPSEEFDAIRWRLAAATEKLLRHPAADRRDSPSVLIDGTDTPPAKVQPLSPFEQAADVGRFETFDLGGGFSNWVNGTAEGKIRITERARHEGKTGLRWTVTVDWEHDGGEGGKYPIGWPRINRSFKPGELDLSRYDSLVFWIRVDSSHDQAGTHRTPIGVVIGSHTVRRSLYGKIVDLGGREHAWTALRFSVPEIMASAGGSAEPWKSISLVQLFISESNFPHGTRLVFDVGEVLAQRMKEPALVGVDAPHHLLLPCRRLSLTFEAAGMTAVSKGSHRISVALERPDGVIGAEARQDLAAGNRMTIACPDLQPGTYLLRATIDDARGRQCSRWTQPIVLHAGPLYY
ncbi:MAG: hypothetical protein ACLQNE_07550 [Thermoguttaceae bacterium]